MLIFDSAWVGDILFLWWDQMGSTDIPSGCSSTLWTTHHDAMVSVIALYQMNTLYKGVHPHVLDCLTLVPPDSLIWPITSHFFIFSRIPLPAKVAVCLNVFLVKKKNNILQSVENFNHVFVWTYFWQKNHIEECWEF